MRSVVVANVSHYHHLARALEDAGYLQRYFTSIALFEHSRIPGVVPRRWTSKLESRRVTGVPSQKVTRIWLPELIQQALFRAPLPIARYANSTNNYLLDSFVRHRIPYCDTFHFMSSIGLLSAQNARALGATIICDARESHPTFRHNITAEESDTYQIPIRSSVDAYEEKQLREYRAADILMVPSHFVKQTFAEQGFSSERIRVVPYGVDTELFTPTMHRAQPFRVLFAGRITFIKGVQYLLQAMLELNLTDVELLLVGGLDPDFRRVLERFGGRYRLLSSVSKVELAELYASASVAVCPSLSDAFGLTVLEAMACGTPVVVTTSTGAADAVTHGVNGFVLAPRDVNGIKQAVLALHGRPDLVEQMGRRARERALQHDWAAYRRSVKLAYADIQEAIEPGSLPRP